MEIVVIAELKYGIENSKQKKEAKSNWKIPGKV